jgi:serine/threonine-protein phosphatase Stp1
MAALRSFAVTDRGTVRPHNEDTFVDAPALGLFAVADGAGGHAAGELASGMLAEALSVLSANLAPAEALAQIRLAVLAVPTALQAEVDAIMLSQVTRDHSLVQALLDQGAITPEQALTHPQGNVITRAIGAPDDDGELDKAIGPAKPGDIFLLCSDGLTKVLDDTTIAQLMVAPDPAQALIQAALAGDARDNVTAVVVCVPEDAR